MTKPDSAMKLFLKHTPDALEHLFDRSISSFCDTEQVQGKIFYDFFLFDPPDPSENLTVSLMNTMLQCYHHYISISTLKSVYQCRSVHPSH